jgi:hypothetical protein
MEIKAALDWQKVGTNLRKQLSSVSYNPDLKQMFKNIEDMVSELSKSEVVARQTKRTYHLESQVQKINKAINHLEKLILIAQVMN